jgi:cytochrome c551/c552/cytochrome c553
MVKDQTGWCLLGVSLLLLVAVENGGAHPAHAKPVNYPFVVGFERFHSGMDDDEYLAGGGFILLNELNCVTCHAPPESLASQLPGMLATDLTGVATRLGPLDLEIMIRNPRFAKRDTTMPSLFAGPDRDLDEVNALKHYLATLTYEIPEYGIGDIEKGRSLYHRIGCVACHAPELGYRPPGLPENAEIELAGLPSVPMNLADLYDLDSLTHFLLHPNEHRPSGRMPDFKLNQAEASDLAAYLKAGPDLVLPDNVTEALTQSIVFELDPALAEKGRGLFQEKNCSACHVAPGEKSELTRHRARSLAELRTDSLSGCFSDRPVGGPVPFYGLDKVQKRAIAAALQRLSSKGALDLNGEIDWRMKQLNCYACHERGGTGGPEVSREVYFGFGEERAIALGRWGNLPPALDHVGAKLTPDWLGRVLYGTNGGGSVRPYLDARMPVFRKADVEPFFTRFPKADVREPQGGSKLAALLNHGTEEAGKKHFFEGEGACIRCHDAGNEKSTEMPGINLATSAARLERTYFEQLILEPQSLQPGTLMPDPVNLDEQGQTIDSLWKWLKSLAP